MRTGPKPRPALERFMAKVQVAQPAGCWIWMGALNSHGYGNFYAGGDHGAVPAHRWAYRHLRGPIPRGLDLDHLCRMRPCVNPDHLDPVTHAENVRRGSSFGGNTCGKGHRFTPENTYIRKDTGVRVCRRCRADTEARRRARIKEAS